MNSFLVNLALRSAGLPLTTIQAPRPSLFGVEIRKQRNGLAEAHGIVRGLRLAEERTPGDGTELNSPVQPVGEPAATASEPPPASRQHAIPDRLQAQVTLIEPLNSLGSALLPFQAHREVITKIDVEQRRYTLSPDSRTTEPVGEPGRHASTVAPSRPIISEPGARTVVSPAELSTEWRRDGAQKTREAALPAATIRPALDESHTLLQFPKTISGSSPTPLSELPIHVRIGRVEVRGATPPTPAPARPTPPAPLGFDGYYRMRTYRS
jgi:hypothetical protein